MIKFLVWYSILYVVFLLVSTLIETYFDDDISIFSKEYWIGCLGRLRDYGWESYMLLYFTYVFMTLAIVGTIGFFMAEDLVHWIKGKVNK